MNDEEKRVRAILKFTFKKLEEMLAQQGVGKQRRLTAVGREQQGKKQPCDHHVGDNVEIPRIRDDTEKGGGLLKA